MLHETFNPDRLAQVLIAVERWRPHPTATDRRAWTRLPAPLRRQLVRRGEEALGAAWPALPATLYLEFARRGDRRRFETPYFGRRTLLARLVLAECVEGRGRFLDPIADAVWSLCEESTWCLPAHVGGQRAGPGLPDTTEPQADLFAGETAALLAWTAYLLGLRLAAMGPILLPRLRREVEVRLLTPCLERDDWWWMGFREGQGVNNWNPWINSNWLASALLLEADPARRTAAVHKSLCSLDRFLAGYPADGGCDEGPVYWNRAGASLFDCLELLLSATGGAINVYREPLIHEIARYIYRAHVADTWFLNFADASAAMTPPAALVYALGERIGDEVMKRFAATFRPPASALHRLVPDGLGRALPALFGLRRFLAVRPAPALPRDVWLPQTQLMVARSRAGSPRGFTLAVKGGHNAESHNHNDVGQFVLYSDGAPVLVDAGVETYTRKTFSPQRYEIWTMQSQYHNLPTVNGVMQQAGREYRAADVTYAAGARRVTFSLDIAGAYPAGARLKRWVRRFEFVRGGGVTLTDDYETDGAPARVVLSLLTPCRVAVRPGALRLRARRLPAGRHTGAAWIDFDAAALRPRVERIAISDPRLTGVWGSALYRVLLEAQAPAAKGTFVLRMRR
jgi:hypothetical protein